MAFMVVEFNVCHWWLWRSVYGIYGCRVQYMSLIAVEICIWHLWLWRSVYGIYGCGGLYMAFMAVEVCICQGPIYVMDGILVMKAS